MSLSTTLKFVFSRMCLLCGFVRELASTGNLKLLNVWQSIWNFVALASGNQILSLPNGIDQDISAPYSCFLTSKFTFVKIVLQI